MHDGHLHTIKHLIREDMLGLSLAIRRLVLFSVIASALALGVSLAAFAALCMVLRAN